MWNTFIPILSDNVAVQTQSLSSVIVWIKLWDEPQIAEKSKSEPVSLKLTIVSPLSVLSVPL